MEKLKENSKNKWDLFIQKHSIMISKASRALITQNTVTGILGSGVVHTFLAGLISCLPGGGWSAAAPQRFTAAAAAAGEVVGDEDVEMQTVFTLAEGNVEIRRMESRKSWKEKQVNGKNMLKPETWKMLMDAWYIDVLPPTHRRLWSRVIVYNL